MFTVAEAAALGVSRRVLQGGRFVQVTPGVHRLATSAMTFDMWVGATVRVLPAGAAISHVTNLRWRGLSMRSETPIHAAVTDWSRPERDQITIHRYIGQLEVESVRGIPLLTAPRTFVDCGTMLSVRELVEVGDWMIQQRLATLETLFDYVTRSHLDGVQRARRAMAFVQPGAESPRESRLRFVLIAAGLPEPEINTDIHDERGNFLARGDLVYRSRKVVVEYDGWHHERDAEQRQSDIVRREKLESAGWRMIVVTAIDMERPDEVVARVRRALASRDSAG